ncbi:MAG: anaerobic carbon-monoxide dehydrogenase catalytic subunit [Desulfovermiculus sp.]
MYSKDIRDQAAARSVDQSVVPLLEKALAEGLETAWERLEEQQPQCGFGQLGVCCNRCALGPCRIDPFRGSPAKGVCGADADLIVARNFLDDLATGAAAHSDHGREVVETLLQTARGEAKGYSIADSEKLRALARELHVQFNPTDLLQTAQEVALALLEEFGTVKNSISFVSRTPEQTRKVWENAGIVPRSVDREIVESMHRIHMGVGADAANILLHGLRTSLSDGWGGSMMATEVSDVLFGTPEIKNSQVNMGVFKPDQVNIVLHGHNPILSELIVAAAQDPEMIKLAQEKGAAGINLAGMCCTGNELMMRRGIPVAGTLLSQELALATGAVEAMIIDYQCIFPSIGQTAACYHTKLISTSEKCKVPGAEHMEFCSETAEQSAEKIVRLAIDNYAHRDEERVYIPGQPMDLTAGFSVEAIIKALGGSPQSLLDAVTSGNIRGAAGIVGCNNPQIKHNYGHVQLAKELIKQDVLVVETGCSAIACAQAGLLKPEAAHLAGPGLKEVCTSLGIPPVLHMGSCVDCSRILVLAGALAKALDVAISDLPLAGAAPEWYSQKAVSIASYFVSSGVYTVLGIPPKIFGSQNVLNLAAEGLSEVVGATFAVEPDPVQAAGMMVKHIEHKRSGLGI